MKNYFVFSFNDLQYSPQESTDKNTKFVLFPEDRIPKQFLPGQRPPTVQMGEGQGSWRKFGHERHVVRDREREGLQRLGRSGQRGMEFRERAPLLHEVNELLALVRIRAWHQVLRGQRPSENQTFRVLPVRGAKNPDGRFPRGGPQYSRGSER